MRIDLVAAEPAVESPVHIAFDENGRLFVAEMRDYPEPPASSAGESRVRMLEDRDGDGRYETSGVFADGLRQVSGVMPWRGGVIVTAALNIYYLTDRDGDGRADGREILFTGFSAGNSQHHVNHPTLGPDNWIYVANGRHGGKISRPGDRAVVDIGGRDFRFDLIGRRFEAVTGQGQFGLTFDDWGQRFECWNQSQFVHMVMPIHYVARNPVLAPPTLAQDDHAAGRVSRVFPLIKQWTTSSAHEGYFTAASGMMIYQGDLLPEVYRGSAFTSEPTGNLIHREIVTPTGATFTARPARDGVEFLASRDSWFRPVSLANGPDGALYVVDMYRKIIEHPDWMSPELRARSKADLWMGKERGRIYRIVPEGYKAAAPHARLGKASTAELIALLSHPNGWARMTAHRLLLERREGTAVPGLRTAVRSSESPLARFHAAQLLVGLDAFEARDALALLRHPHARLRETGLRLAEGFLPEAPAVQEKSLALIDDVDPRVRFQAALSLGAWKSDRILPALAAIAVRDAADKWTRLAIASSVADRAGALMALVLPRLHPGSPAHRDLLRELATITGSRGDMVETTALLAALFGRTSGPRWLSMTAMVGLAEGVAKRGGRFDEVLAAVRASPQGATRIKRVAALMTTAAGLAANAAARSAERLDAIRLLGTAPWPLASDTLARLLVEDPAPDVRIAAVTALAAHERPEVATTLIAAWGRLSPPVRREAAAALLRKPQRISQLLDAIEQQKIPANHLDAATKRQLTESGAPELRARGRKVLASSLPADRKEAIARFTAALSLAGDPKRGRSIFEKACAPCHRVAGVGVSVGPDIADTLRKTPETILLDILDPNRAIDANYTNYVVMMKSGSMFTGFIAAETATSLTLRGPDGREDQLLRQDIADVQSGGASLMPEGLEQAMTVQDMADLLGFLKNWRFSLGAEAQNPW